MTPKDLTIIDGENGDCLRASIASLFDLDLQQVPHFILFNGSIEWETVLSGFIWAMGYNWISNGDPTESKIINSDQTIKGFTEACVPSKNFPEKFHSVVINSSGLVVHDPNPKHAYQGINVIESNEIISWMVFEKY